MEGTGLQGADLRRKGFPKTLNSFRCGKTDAKCFLKAKVAADASELPSPYE